MMRLKGAFTAFLIVAAAMPAAAQDKQPPYWASIASGEAMTRTGPGRNYPGVWLYKRRDLPVRVVKKYENWRMIEDLDGAQGWMLVSLLSDRRTAVVKKGDPRPIRVKPDEGSPIRYNVEAGVVGRIEHRLLERIGRGPVGELAGEVGIEIEQAAHAVASS